MIDGIDVKILAQRDLTVALKLFRDEVSARVAKNAAKKVAEFMQRQLRAAAPAFTGRLRFNLFVRAQYVKRRGVVRSTVAVRTEGKAGNPRNAFYWRFLEFGHLTRPAKKEGAAQRKIPPDNFIERTFLSAQTQAQSIFFGEMQSGVEKAARKSKNLRIQ